MATAPSFGTSPPVPARSPSRLYAQRTPPRAPNRQADPFADPFADEDETLRQSFPVSEASRYSEASPALSSGSRHSRSRTMANLPIITHTAPSIASSHRADGSADSRNGSPGTAGGPFAATGLGIRRSGSGASNGPSLYPTPLRSAAARFAQHHQRAPEPALLSATSGGPAGAAPGRYKRLSNASASSNGSSSLSIEFPSSWGEPGPTRPGSMVGGEPAAPAAAAAAGGAPPRAGASRVSDPFDLDVPELLSYAESHYSSSSSLAPAPTTAPGARAPPTVATLADEPASRKR
jgi:hypothetical protein